MRRLIWDVINFFLRLMTPTLQNVKDVESGAADNAVLDALAKTAKCTCGFAFRVVMPEGLLKEYASQIECPACGEKRASL